MNKFIKYFKYNPDMAKKKDLNANIKILIKLIISVLICYISFRFFLNGIDTSFSVINNTTLKIIVICIVFLSFIGFAIASFCYLVLLATNKSIEMYRDFVMYAVDTEKSVYKIRLKVNPSYYHMLSNQLIGEIIGLAIDIINTKQQLNDKGNVDYSYLLQSNEKIEDVLIYKYVNIYSVKKVNEGVEFVCDSVDLSNNEKSEKETNTIYNYYDDFDELYKLLVENKDKSKENIENIKSKGKDTYIGILINNATEKTKRRSSIEELIISIVFFIALEGVVLTYNTFIGLMFLILFTVFPLYLSYRYNLALGSPNKKVEITQKCLAILYIINFIYVIIKIISHN